MASRLLTRLGVVALVSLASLGQALPALAQATGGASCLCTISGTSMLTSEMSPATLASNANETQRNQARTTCEGAPLSGRFDASVFSCTIPRACDPSFAAALNREIGDLPVRASCAAGPAGGGSTTPAPTPTGGTTPGTPPQTTPTTSTGATDEAASGGTEEGAPRPFVPIRPNPAVPIPGVEFTDAREENGLIEIPYLAQYISGIYRLSVGLGAILAAIMIVYGGFRYMLAAALPQIQESKSIIQDAVIGLVVLLSSFLILKTINPKLVEVAPLRIQRISYETAADIALDTTRIATDDSSNEAIVPDSNTSGSRPSSGPSSGQNYVSTSVTTACPFPNLPVGHIDCGPNRPDGRACSPEHCRELGRPAGCSDSARVNRDERANVFLQHMTNRMSSMNPSQRAIEFAQAAVACQIHFGSCNSSAHALTQAAAIPPAGSRRFSRIREVRGLRCNTSPGCSYSGPGTCTTDNAEAKRRVRDLFRATQDANIARLQVGDHIYVYVAGTADCAGMHSVTFLGWVNEQAGTARVFSGQWGHNVKIYTYCFKTSCNNGNYMPLVSIR